MTYLQNDSLYIPNQQANCKRLGFEPFLVYHSIILLSIKSFLNEKIKCLTALLQSNPQTWIRTCPLVNYDNDGRVDEH